MGESVFCLPAGKPEALEHLAVRHYSDDFGSGTAAHGFLESQSTKLAKVAFRYCPRCAY